MSDEPRCPVPHGDIALPRWDEDAERAAERAARSAAAGRGTDEERAVLMARAAAESRAQTRGVEEISARFVESLGHKLGYGHPLSERTGTLDFTWTPEALARLEQVPEFCRELARWRVEWTAQKRGLGTVITPEIMDVKFDAWAEVSHAIEARRGSDEGLPWTDSAYARFERVPEFVRGQVLEAIEGNARRLGVEVVDDSVVDGVVARWAHTGDFHEGMYGFK